MKSNQTPLETNSSKSHPSTINRLISKKSERTIKKIKIKEHEWPKYIIIDSKISKTFRSVFVAMFGLCEIYHMKSSEDFRNLNLQKVSTNCF